MSIMTVIVNPVVSDVPVVAMMAEGANAVMVSMMSVLPKVMFPVVQTTLIVVRPVSLLRAMLGCVVFVKIGREMAVTGIG